MVYICVPNFALSHPALQKKKSWGDFKFLEIEDLEGRGERRGKE